MKPSPKTRRGYSRPLAFLLFLGAVGTLVYLSLSVASDSGPKSGASSGNGLQQSAEDAHPFGVADSIDSHLAGVPGLPDENRLVELALTGDRQAGCVLAVRWTRCEELREQTALFEEWLHDRVNAPRHGSKGVPPSLRGLSSEMQRTEDPMLSRMREQEERIEELEATCSSGAARTRQEIVEMWRIAALSGSPEARWRYLSGEFGFNHHSNAQEAQIFANTAPQVLASGLSGGDVAVARLAADAYSPLSVRGETLLSTVVRADLDRSVLLYGEIVNSFDRAAVAREANDHVSHARVQLTRLRAAFGDVAVDAALARRSSMLSVLTLKPFDPSAYENSGPAGAEMRESYCVY